MHHQAKRMPPWEELGVGDGRRGRANAPLPSEEESKTATIYDIHSILGFFDPLMSAKSILFVRKMCAFLTPNPLLCGRHIWKPPKVFCGGNITCHTRISLTARVKTEECCLDHTRNAGSAVQPGESPIQFL